MTNPKIMLKMSEKMVEKALESDTITYSKLSEHIGGIISELNLRIPLDEINVKCHELGLPMISSLVVGIGTGIPGDGYFKLYKELYGSRVNEINKWSEELKKVYSVKDWAPLLNAINAM